MAPSATPSRSDLVSSRVAGGGRAIHVSLPHVTRTATSWSNCRYYSSVLVRILFFLLSWWIGRPSWKGSARGSRRRSGAGRASDSACMCDNRVVVANFQVISRFLDIYRDRSCPLFSSKGQLFPSTIRSRQRSRHRSRHAVDNAIRRDTTLRHGLIVTKIKDKRERKEWTKRKSGREGWWKRKKEIVEKEGEQEVKEERKRARDRYAGWVGGRVAEEEVRRKFLVGKPVFLG